MRRYGNYIEKLANNIEDRLNMSSREISQLTPAQFRSILKHKYFRQKEYAYAQSEPTDRQMDVLNEHYGIARAPERIVREKYPYRRISEKEVTMRKFSNKDRKAYNIHKGKKYYPNIYRVNKAGRYIDAKTGRFVRVIE